MQPLLVAVSAEDLRRALALLDIQVLRRAQGRTKTQTERFSIAYLLASLPTQYLKFPLTLEHSERPDFVLRLPSVTVGIEVTEAVPENHARASVIRQSGIGKSVHFVKRARPGEETQSTESLRDEIKLDRPGEPWVGNEPESECAEAMLYCAVSKAATAHKPGFKIHPINWLLVYDNWPLPGHHHSEANALLAAGCDKPRVLSPENRTHLTLPPRPDYRAQPSILRQASFDSLKANGMGSSKSTLLQHPRRPVHHVGADGGFEGFHHGLLQTFFGGGEGALI